LDLDPSLRSLLKDVDISLAHHQSHHSRSPPRALEELSADQSLTEAVVADDEASVEEEMLESDRNRRKSPAAQFGSQRIGAVVLPLELQRSIGAIIAGKSSGLE
jgi:hypothetical protein